MVLLPFLFVFIIEVNSMTSDTKKLSFNFSKKSVFKTSLFFDNSKSPPKKIFELFSISFSMQFLKIVTVEKINRLKKIVKKTLVI